MKDNLRIADLSAYQLAILNKQLREKYGCEIREGSGRLWLGLKDGRGGMLLHSQKTVGDARAFGEVVKGQQTKQHQ